MEILTEIKQVYNELFITYADERVYAWPLMSEPSTILLIIATYIYFVTSLGPKLMKDRQPFNLNTTLIIYNFIQIVCCVLLIHKYLTSGWTENPSLKCEVVDYSNNPTSVGMAEGAWWTMLLKLLELLETVLFVLRKKQNQVSGLHVYHHSSTLAFIWFGTKYFAGKMTSFCIMLNCVVHMVMYSYYLLSATGNASIMVKVEKWKKYITIIQMVQFCIIVAYCSQLFLPRCYKLMPNVKYVAIAFITNVIVHFYLFYNFFKKSYKNKSK